MRIRGRANFRVGHEFILTIRKFIMNVAAAHKFLDGRSLHFFFSFQFIYAKREIARLFRDDYSARLISNELETTLRLSTLPPPAWLTSLMYNPARLPGAASVWYKISKL